MASFATFLSIALLVSCVTYSIHPLYDDETAIFEPTLIGTWIDPAASQNPAKIVFTKGDGSAYIATYFDPDDHPAVTNLFDAHVVKFSGRLFLDAVQTGVRVSGQDAPAEYTIASHLIARVSIDEDKLHLDFLDDSWLRDGFATGKVTLPHEVVDGDVVLTASTADLQNFVSEHANDDEAFPPSHPLIRAK
jgi:hypothetical protein